MTISAPSHSERRLERALAAFDAANAEDPNLELDPESSEPAPKEWLYGRRMSRRLEAFAPDASEVVRLAVRAQHIRRWEVPRSDFPSGRTGYLQWRIHLYGHHAETAGAILAKLGYEAETIERVSSLLRKRQLRTDDEAQRVEDVACLVFLEHYFHEFASKHDAEKLTDILQKTWQKMSPAAREAALELPLTPEDRQRIVAALETR